MSGWSNSALTSSLVTLHRGSSSTNLTTPSPPLANDQIQHDYLERMTTSGVLYTRECAAIVDAPPIEMAVLRGYAKWSNKGPLTPDRQRLTIVTAKTNFAVGEESACIDCRLVNTHCSGSLPPRQGQLCCNRMC
jgi:hypothetical protein